MMRCVFIVAVAAGLALAAAECPNACSGNGVCNNYRDFCECYAPYQGNDCSQRSCPFGLAWADVPQGDLDHDGRLDSGFGDYRVDADNDPAGHTASSAVNPMWRPKGWWERHPSQLYGTDADYTGNSGDANDLGLTVKKQEGHFYAECSSRGLCDHKTGVCQCFTGFEGAACNRTVCPNKCNGHGTCKNLRTVGPTGGTEYRLWDADKNYGCVCDTEYEGPDCSLRRCYKNDDPLTPTTTRQGYSEQLAEQDEVQRVQIKCANGGGISQTSKLALHYTDVQFGKQYRTDWLSLAGGTADDDGTYAATLLDALRGLPNDVLASTNGYDKLKAVSRVTMVDEHNNNWWYYFVTFDHSLGNVPLMTVDTTQIVCRGGWTIASHDAAWFAMPYLRYYSDGDDSTETRLERGVTVDMTLELETITAAQDTVFGYDIELEVAGATHSADSSFVVSSYDGDDFLDPAIMDLIPMYFEFPEGATPADGLNAYGAAGAKYKIEFKAPAADCEVITPSFETATTLPVQYMVASETSGELLYIEYTDPYANDLTGSQLITLAATYVALGTDTLAGNDGAAVASFDAFNGWQRLRDTATGAHGEHVKISTEYGVGDQSDDYVTARTASSGNWEFNAVPGTIYAEQTTAPNIVLENIGTTRAYDRVDLKITGFASGDGTTMDYYQLELNDLLLGTYEYVDRTCAEAGCELSPSGWPTSDEDDSTPDQELLGDTTYGRPTDLTTFAFTWGTGATTDATRLNANWHFSLVRLPYQRSWGYLETFRGWYFSNTSPGTSAALAANNGRWIDPHALTDGVQTANIGVVLNWVDLSEDIDTYRWKLSQDERWMTGNTLNRGEALKTGALTDTFQLGRMDSLTPAHAYLDDYAFQLGGGVGSGDRACDGSTNAYLYLQFGLEGINDFPECSDRGVCNRQTGLCECFRGYKGTDCSLQSALAV